MHHDRPIDALPDNPPQLPAKKTTKRPASKANVGRTHSIGTVWEFQDEGDLGVQGQGDQHPPKRRRSAPPKRSKSAKALSQSLPQIAEADEEGHSELQNNEQDQQNSQLSTPPDSAKRTKSKPGSKSKKPQLPPFKSLTVTKQVPKQEKEQASDPISSSSAVKSQLGWRTTQDAVKLAKTTLDKLAAFQYKPPLQTNLQDQVVTTARYAKTHPIAGILQPESVEHDKDPSSSDFRPHPSHGDFFTEACANTRVIDVFDREHIMNVPEDTYLRANQVMEQMSNPVAATQVEELQTSALGSDDRTAVSCSYNVGNSSENYLHPTNLTAPSQEVSCFDESTSSEVRAMDGLMQVTEMSPIDQQPIPGESHHCVTRPDEIFNEVVPVHQGALSYIVSSEAGAGAGAEDPTLPEQDFEEVLQGLVLQPATQPQLVPNRLPRAAKDIQVERSNDDQFEDVQQNVSRDFDLDEFDEGLDDSDLLELASDAIVPDTQCYTRSIPLNNPKSSDIITSPLGPTEIRDRPAPLQQTALTTNNVQSYRAMTGHASLDVEILESEDGDDFPMDAADEAMMVQAAEVVETFDPPESFQHPFDDSESVEVFDSSLQYSPPKPQQLHSTPSKKVDGHRTGAISKPQSPDLEPPTTSMEEDWSFIRRRDANVEAPSETEEDYRCSVVDTTTVRLVTEFFKPQSTQRAPNSTNPILDDSHEYLPLKAFVRPDFPNLTPDRSPIVGVSTQSFLRVCFRIGEMIKEGGRRNALSQDAVIELFAKVIFSTREAPAKQRFQFKDIFSEKPPIADGVLMNYKTTGLAESESKVFIGKGHGTLARCLGRLKRDKRTASGWMLHIITIRETDWEEIRWTKRIVSAGLVKSETPK